MRGGSNSNSGPNIMIPSMVGKNDATDPDISISPGPLPPIVIPSTVNQQKLVQSLISAIPQIEQWNWLVNLSLFPDRYWTSRNGVAAASWIMSTVQALQPIVNSRAKLSVKQFDHSWKMQPSVIARYEPSSGTGLTSDQGIVIIGSHFDTIVNNDNGNTFPESYANPAADVLKYPIV